MRFIAGGMILLASLSACSSSAGRQNYLQEHPDIDISSQELRLRVRDLVRPLAGILERAADRIIERTDDPAIRRWALRAKTEAIPALIEALFRQDAGAALVDASAYVEQLRFAVA